VVVLGIISFDCFPFDNEDSGNGGSIGGHRCVLVHSGLVVVLEDEKEGVEGGGRARRRLSNSRSGACLD
jgi:hypothetical protein